MEYFKQKNEKGTLEASSLELKFKIISLIKSHKFFCKEKNLPAHFFMEKKWTLANVVTYWARNFLWARNINEFIVAKKSDAIIKAEVSEAAKMATSSTIPTTEIKNLVVITQIASDKFSLFVTAVDIKNNKIVCYGVDSPYYSQCGEYRTLHVLDNGDIKFYRGQPLSEDKNFDLSQYLPDLVEKIKVLKSQSVEETKENASESLEMKKMQ